MNKIILSVAVVGLAIGDFGFRSRQLKFSTGPQSIQAGKSTEQAKHAGEGIVTTLHDTKITAKVKAALLEEKLTGNSHIHVNTVAGVVTLSGTSKLELARTRMRLPSGKITCS